MFRFLKNKRKYTYTEIKIPADARELTEEEMLMVNGGGKAKEETTVTVERGDTLSELTARLNEQNGTDYTYQEIAQMNGITDPDTIYAGQTIVFPGTRQPESGSDSGSSGDTPSSPSSSNSINDATANTVKGPEHRSAHDQKYINEMMEKDRKNALGGNRIQGNAVAGKKVEEREIKVNPGAGNMTITDYIAKQRKLGTGTTVSGQTVGEEKARGMSAGEGNLTERGYPSSRDANLGKHYDGNLTERGYPGSKDANIGKYEVNLADQGYPSSRYDPKYESPIPEYPEGVDLDMNVSEAKKMGPTEFYNAVRNGGKWDYKQQGSQFENFGNFNYGVTGKAARCSDEILKRAAGWAQERAGTSLPEWGHWYGGYPYGDDPADQIQIQKGIDYYNERYK